MEKKTIVKLAVSAVLVVLAVVFACGLGRGGEVTYQVPGPYTAESANDFSTVQVAMTIQGETIIDCAITSSGDSDLLNDEIRAEWAQSIVDAQSYENDAISSATLTYSAASVKEASADIFTQAGLPLPEPAATPEPEQPEAPAEASEPAGEAAALTDGSYSVTKATDFSTIDVGLTVENGAIAAATVASEGANDLLTDDVRSAWADQIVASQSVDAVSGVTVSSNAVQEAVAELLAQASGGSDAGALTDGSYSVTKTTDFSTIDVGLTVENGAIAAATVASEGANDLLTDDVRNAWADQIVASQSVDAVSGVTVSSNAVQEAVAELLAQASGGSEAGDAKVAELEAALAEAEARAAEAEAKAAEAETKLSEAETKAAEAESKAAEAEAKVAELEAAAEAQAEAEPAEPGDASRFMRVRPAIAQVLPEVEAEAETAGEAADADASRFMRQRPAEVQAEAETAESEPAGETADASRFMRQRPAGETPVETAVEAEAAEPTEADRLAAILPGIVTTMGDNRENNYVVDYLEQDPYLVNIYEGYGFAKDYGSARGHEYTLEDVAKTQRPHPKANCITCKTPDLHKMIEEQGIAVYSMPFDEVFPQMTNNISCYTCHGDDMGNGGALKVTHQYVNEALGENVASINPSTLSCGQCHIEYYFTPADSETMMPYHSVEEMAPEAILAYYDALGFADWTQESTGTPMLKAQHPEMETFLQGKHAAFLSCADCHMPLETTDSGFEFRSHTLVSPLESEALLQSCAQCHGDTDMVAFVRDIQDRVTAREREVGNALSGMKDALAEAVATGEWSEDDLNAVRKLHREAQWFFDYCYVENSEGAHNSELAMRCLDTSEQKIEEAMKLLSPAKT